MAPMRLTLVRVAASLLVATAALGSGDADRTRRHPPVHDRFVAVSAGVVFDRSTGLEWTARDHDDALDWEHADRYCRTLRLGRRARWRLPEIEEIEALYDRRVESRCGERPCHLDPAISLRGPYVWTATSRGEGTRFYFEFTFGNSFSPGTPPTLVRRVLCARQRW